MERDPVQFILAAVRDLGPEPARYAEVYPVFADVRISVQPGGHLLFNYAERAVYQETWDPIVEACRGLVVRYTPEVALAARPFPKFYNLGEKTKTDYANLPAEPWDATMKLDGSLGLLLWEGEVPRIITRGSFTSAQAQWATRWIRNHHAKHPLAIRHDLTLLFEIIYPENRDNLAMRYGDKADCTLIGAVRFDGYDYGWPELSVLGKQLHLPVVERVVSDADLSLEQLAELAQTRENEEGWVVRYSSGFRVKVKTLWYVTAHRMVSRLHLGRVRDHIMLEGLEAWQTFLLTLPDDIQPEARALATDVLARADARLSRARAVFAEWTREGFVDHVRATGKEGRKEYALRARAEVPPDDMGFMFGLLDNRNVLPDALKVLDFGPEPVTA